MATLGLAERLTRDEFAEGALRAGVICLPVLDFADLAVHEQYRVNEQFLTVRDDPLNADLSMPRSPVDAMADGVVLRRAPLLGEHTAEVLESLPSPSGHDTATGAAAADSADGRVDALARRGPVADPRRALEGLRVVDFGWVLAAPIGTRILASFGADVIRVESSQRPDSMRSQAGPDGEPDPDLGGLFNDVNAGKRSLSVDVSTPAGRGLVMDLVAHADIVVNNFRPGALDRMGFGYEELCLVKPDIVLLSMPGAHPRGPWAARPSMGNILMAASGFNSLMGFPGRPPRGVGIAYPDFTSPYLLVTTILAAIRQRDRGGGGQRLDLTQLSGMISLLGVPWMHYRSTGVVPTRSANRSPNHCPHGVYPCAGEDEWCAIAVASEGEFSGLCAALGRNDLVVDPRFSSLDDRKANEDALDAIVGVLTRGWDRWELGERLQQAGVAAAPVEHLDDLMERDPDMQGHYQRVRQPVAPDLDIPIDGECIRFRGWPHRLTRAPAIGEHNEDIVRGLLGYDDERYVGLLLGDVLR